MLRLGIIVFSFAAFLGVNFTTIVLLEPAVLKIDEIVNAFGWSSGIYIFLFSAIPWIIFSGLILLASMASAKLSRAPSNRWNSKMFWIFSGGLVAFYLSAPLIFDHSSNDQDFVTEPHGAYVFLLSATSAIISALIFVPMFVLFFIVQLISDER